MIKQYLAALGAILAPKTETKIKQEWKQKQTPEERQFYLMRANAKRAIKNGKRVYGSAMSAYHNPKFNHLSSKEVDEQIIFAKRARSV